MRTLRPLSRRLAAMAPLAAAGLLASPSAYALDPECPSAFTSAGWTVAMDQIDAAFADSRVEAARSGLDQTHAAVRCLDHAAAPALLARFARQEALAAFFDQDEDSMVKWGMTSRTTADLAWDLPEDHPFRALVTVAPEPIVAGPDGSLALERGVALFLDGAPITEPRAHAEIPHLAQLVDRDGTVLRAFWQDGAAFPSDLIGPLAVAKADHPRRIDLGGLAAGGAAGAVAIGLYGMASMFAGDLDHATSATEMAHARTTANWLVLGSGIAGAAAVGVGVTAFFADDGAGLGVHGRF